MSGICRSCLLLADANHTSGNPSYLAKNRPSNSHQIFPFAVTFYGSCEKRGYNEPN